ncbi:MAG: peptide ABC transporter substrate-binding protein [Alphaproteobacteria bacterium]|nr:peptide ABC transporter substrate-binding protein [Alphaproteobacteria bacterium]
MTFSRALMRVSLAAAVAAGTLTLAVPLDAATLHRGNGAEPETLDPQKSTGVPEAHIARDTFEGLVAEAADGKLIPGVAERWDIAEDGTTYTFHLRRNAKWSNGDPVTAQDFVYSYRRILDPKTASKYAFMLWPLKNGEAVNKGQVADLAQIGATAKDEHTLVLTLERPTPYLIGSLAHKSAYPVSRKAIEAHGDRWTRPGNFVGNGAYVLREWTPQSHIKLVKSPTYHGAAGVKIDEVMFYPTEDIAAEYKRYRAGELDMTNEIPPDQIEAARAATPAETKISPYFGTYYFAFNVTAAPFKDNVKLRQALSLAIDREMLTERVTRAGEVPAYSWVPPGTANYQNVYAPAKDMKQAERDALAKKLFAESGAPKGLEVEFLYNTHDLHRRIAIAVASIWDEKLGVKIKLVNKEWKVYLDDSSEKKFQMRRAGWIGDYNDANTFVELLKSDIGKQNPAGWANAKYDELMRKATAMTNLAERAKVMSEAERIMLEEAPIAPIYYYVKKSMVKPHVKGWVANVMDVHPTRWLSIEK